MDALNIKKHLIRFIRQGIQFNTEEGQLHVSGDLAGLDQAARTLISTNKAAIIEVLTTLAHTSPKLEIQQQRRAPLSYSQMQLWLIEQIHGQSTQYNMPARLHLQGVLDKTALQHALNRLVASHDVLRTVMIKDDQGEPYQQVQATRPVLINTQDIQELTRAQQDKKLTTLSRAEAVYPFDLTEDLLLRATLIYCQPTEHELLITLHHIAADGWSMGLLIKQFSQYYQEAIQQTIQALPSPTLQYIDYALWQRDCVEGGHFDTALSYWKKQLQHLPVCHDLPIDFSRPVQQTFAGAHDHYVLTDELYLQLTTFCQVHAVTLFTLMHSVLVTVIHQYTHNRDIVIGTPVACRDQPGTESLIGFLANSLVLRSKLNIDDSFINLVKQCQETMSQGLAHQQIPFELLTETLQPERSQSHNPLFQIMLVMDNAADETLTIDGLVIDIHDLSDQAAHVDIALTLSIQAQQLQLTWEYNTDLFQAATIARLHQHLLEILTQALAHPQSALSTFSLLSATEQQQYLFNSQHSTQQALHYSSVIEQCWQQAQRTPMATAIIDGQQQYSYAELVQKSELLAGSLRHEGIQAGSNVGLLMTPSYSLCVGLLAVMSMGCSAVLLDPDYPVARLAYMMEDSAMSAVLVTTATAKVPLEWEVLATKQIHIDTLSLQAPYSVVMETLIHSAACLFYTSGSTGAPKGVSFSHLGLVNYAQSMSEILGANEQSRFLQMASIGFDVFLEELFPCWFAGGTVVLAASGLQRVEKLHQQLIEYKISCFEISFAHWREWLVWMQQHQQSPPPSLQSVMVGCESIPHILMQQWRVYGVTLHHVFGLTETTITNTVWTDRGKDISHYVVMPIGRPIANTEIYVLDPQQRPVPVGVAGELYIGGFGVTLGYYNKADLTKERYINHPFVQDKSTRLYKTGDWVRQLADGELQFIGRQDNQLKIRGFRVELAEVEGALLACAEVNQAMVVAKENHQKTTELVAYFCVDQTVIPAATPEQEIVVNIRHALREYLPDHMLPTQWILLERFPLTAHGKIDQKALPEPKTHRIKNEYIAPSSEIERQLCVLWQELFSVEKVGIHDNFFTLGGHSLLIMKLVARLPHPFQAFSPKEIFTYPTIAELAQHLNELTPTATIEYFQAPANRIPEHCTEILPEMLTLIDLTAEDILFISERVPGGMSNIQEIYPLAPLQQGMLYHHLMAHEQDPYIMSAIFYLEKDRLSQVMAGLEFLIQRHDSLRTAVVLGLDTPVQVVLRQGQLPLHEVTLTAKNSEVDCVAELKTHAVATLPLTEAPLWRITLGKSEQHTGSYLLLQEHHLINDHVGLDILKEELTWFVQEQTQVLPPAKPYRDFIAYAASHDQSVEAKQYFQEQLGLIDRVSLPFGLTSSTPDHQQMILHSQWLSETLSARIREAAKTYRHSPAILFHAAWALLLASTSDHQEQVVFGSVLSGRLQPVPGIDRMMGSFINTLPLAIPLHNQTVIHLLNTVQQHLQQLVKYEHTPLSFAQAQSSLPQGEALINTLLNYRFSDLSLEVIPGFYFIEGEEHNNYPLSVSIDDISEQGTFRVEYQVLECVDITQVVAKFEQILDQLLMSLEQTAGNTPLSALNVLPKADQQQQLYDWQSAITAFAEEQELITRFEKQAQQNPTAIALEAQGQTLSYGELNYRANQLGHYLLKQGVQPGELVGLYYERKLALIIGLLGILKAGAGYVPVDDAYPQERVEQILHDAQVSYVLTSSHLENQIAGLTTTNIILDSEIIEKALAVEPSTATQRQKDSTRTAYLIYTSGSTGQPKGVSVSHRSVQGLLHWVEETYRMEQLSRVLMGTSIGFDLSVFELWSALSFGGCAVLVENILAVLEDNTLAPSLLNTVPSALATLLAQQSIPKSVKTINVAGEPLKQPLVNAVLALGHVQQLYNLYGPSEDTTYSTVACFNQPITSAPTIGRPITNTQAYVLNEAGQLLPAGYVGELYLGGAGVAQGYWQQAKLTAEKFIQLSLPEVGLKRLYRTGDSVRWRADGELEFLGRQDNQVKIRGYRIELGEIEHQLLQCSEIDDAVVLVNKTGQEATLTAYLRVRHSVDTKTQKTIEQSARQQLKKVLPEAMQPHYWVVLTDFPLTANGKINRKAFPKPSLSPLSSIEFMAPRTSLEQQLCTIWANVLGVELVGIQDNFFALGGHSLLMMRLISQIQQLGYVITISEILTNPSVIAVSALLQSRTITTEIANVVNSASVPKDSTQITPEMLPLVTLTQAEINEVIEISGGDLGNIQDIYPLAPLQEGMLFHHIMNEAADPYVAPALLTLPNQTALERFISAIHSVLMRHDVLRTAIFWRDREIPLQVVFRELSLPIEYLDLPIDQDSLTLMQARYKNDKHQLDLEQGPLFAVQIAKDRQHERYFVLIKHHHILIDHISFELLYYELATIMQGNKATLPEPVQFKTFVAHALTQKNNPATQQFFQDYLGDVQEPTYPLGLTETHSDGRDVDVLSFTLEPTLSTRIRNISQQQQVNTATLFHTAWAMVIGACSYRDDVVFGTVFSGRLQGAQGSEYLMGMTLNTLPCRVSLQEASAQEVVQQVYQTLTALLAYEQADLAEVLQQSGLRTDIPLFSGIINFRHTDEKQLEQLTQLSELKYLADKDVDNYLFSLSVDDFTTGFGLDVQVTHLVGARRVADLQIAALTQLLNALEQRNTAPILSLSVLPQQEQIQLDQYWNATQVELPKSQTLLQALQLQAAEKSTQIAIKDKENQLSYKQLDQCSHQLVIRLQQMGVQPGTVVGIYAQPSVELFISLVAIMKLGGTFVLLDPDYPASRIAFIMADSGMRYLLLTTGTALITEPNITQYVVSLAELAKQTEPTVITFIDSTAYPVGLFYTSGSTGEPKGVYFNHQGLINYSQAMAKRLCCDANSRFLQLASVGFDVILEELLPCWFAGGSVVVADQSVRHNLSELQHLLSIEKITHIEISLGHWKAWLQWLDDEKNVPPHSLKQVLVGCESIAQSLMQQWQQYHIPLVHVFGLTEATITTTTWHSDDDDFQQYAVMPIGRPIDNTQVYILNSGLTPVPIGAIGELYIGGLGLSSGYHQQPEQTTARFITRVLLDPETGLEKIQRLYKTGDLARWLKQGQLQFIGRNDEQIKIRGFRVELGEIETHLLACTGVRDAIVIIDGTEDNKQLIAYVIAQPFAASTLATDCQQTLQAHLPGYMVPSDIITIDAIPLTLHGKLDRGALPKPHQQWTEQEIVAPSNALERLLLKQCAILFQCDVERLSMQANFFTLGGHSLAAMKLTGALQKQGYPIHIAMIFAANSLKELANSIQIAQDQPSLDSLTTIDKSQTDELVL